MCAEQTRAGQASPSRPAKMPLWTRLLGGKEGAEQVVRLPPVHLPQAPPAPSAPLLPGSSPRHNDGIELAAAESQPFGAGQGGETLEGAWATALAANRLLESKRWAVSSAEYSLKAARAQRWPSVSVDGSYTVRSDQPSLRITHPAVPPGLESFAIQQNESFAFRGIIDLPLYTSGQIRAAIDAAEARLSAAAVDQDEARGQLKLQVAEAYLNVLRAQREVEVCQQAVRSLQAHYRDVQLLFSHEQVPENDLLSARVALADAQQKLIQARNTLDLCRSAYNRYLGRALDTPVCLAEVEPQLGAEDLQQLTEEAIRSRPVMASLALQAQALQHQAESVRAKSAPQVTLRGEYAFEENRYRNPEGVAAVGVGLWWNAFDAGRNRHEAAALLHQAESVRRMMLDWQSRVALEVRQAWLDIQQAHNRLEVTAEAIRWADENLRIARKRYLAGVGTSTEVLDAETQRAHAFRNHYHALYDAVLAGLKLQYATGRLQR